MARCDMKDSENTGCEGAGKLSSSESCIALSRSQEEEAPSCSYDNPFGAVEIRSVTSSCSIQCLNCKRLTSKLSKVYDDMQKLRRQNEILLAQKLIVRPHSDDYEAQWENPYLEKKHRETFHISESDEEAWTPSRPVEEEPESQESAQINVSFTINVNFVPENGSRGHCGLSEPKVEKPGAALTDACMAPENPEAEANKENVVDASADAATAPQMQAMITIQMKMMDDLMKAPTITCIEKSGSGSGPGKWLVELETPKAAGEDPADDVSGNMKEKMHKEATHLLQTIREFFDQQLTNGRFNLQQQPPTVTDMSQTGAIPKGQVRVQPKRRKSSSSSGKSFSSSDHSPESGCSNSSLEGESAETSCPICFMVYPPEFKTKEKAEHKNCHLWPRY